MTTRIDLDGKNYSTEGNLKEAQNSESDLSALLYADRDIMKLDDEGGYYFKHVSAMTGESLHCKSDIAAELGWRDREIDRLKMLVKGRNLDGSLIPAEPFSQSN